MRFRILGWASVGSGAGAWVKQLRKGAKKSGVKAKHDMESMLSEIKLGAKLVNKLSATNRAIADLNAKLKMATEKDGYLKKALADLVLPEMVKLQSAFMATRNMKDRYQLLMMVVWGKELAVIDEQVEELQYIRGTTESTMKLVYTDEFGGSHNKVGNTIVDYMREQVEIKAGVEQKSSKKAG